MNLSKNQAYYRNKNLIIPQVFTVDNNNQLEEIAKIFRDKDRLIIPSIDIQEAVNQMDLFFTYFKDVKVSAVTYSNDTSNLNFLGLSRKVTPEEMKQFFHLSENLYELPTSYSVTFKDLIGILARKTREEERLNDRFDAFAHFVGGVNFELGGISYAFPVYKNGKPHTEIYYKLDHTEYYEESTVAGFSTKEERKRLLTDLKDLLKIKSNIYSSTPVPIMGDISLKLEGKDSYLSYRNKKVYLKGKLDDFIGKERIKSLLSFEDNQRIKSLYDYEIEIKDLPKSLREELIKNDEKRIANHKIELLLKNPDIHYFDK